MKKWATLLAVVALPAFAGGFKESVEIHCTVSKVIPKYMAGLNEGQLTVFNPNVDHIQPTAHVSVVAGSEKRVIKIGESTFEKGHSPLTYTRDKNGNYEFTMEHGDIEEMFIVTYNRAKQTGVVKQFPSDAEASDAKTYAELDCK